MPDNNNNNDPAKNNGQDPAGAGAGNGDGSNKGNDQGGNNGGGANGDQPNGDQGAGAAATISIDKAKYDKDMSDLENYKKAVIGDKRPLPDNSNGGGDNSGGAAPEKPATTGVDAKQAEEIATRVSNKNIQASNEKSAKTAFYKKYPEYVDSKAWQELVLHYTPKSGKEDVDSILSDLEDAVLVHKRRSGKLDEFLAEQRRQAEREAEINARVNLGNNSGGVGERSNSGGTQDKIPDSTIKMGENFGHSSEQIKETLQEVNKTSEGYVFDVTKPKVKK